MSELLRPLAYGELYREISPGFWVTDLSGDEIVRRLRLEIERRKKLQREELQREELQREESLAKLSRESLCQFSEKDELPPELCKCPVCGHEKLI